MDPRRRDPDSIFRWQFRPGDHRLRTSEPGEFRSRTARDVARGQAGWASARAGFRQAGQRTLAFALFWLFETLRTLVGPGFLWRFPDARLHPRIAKALPGPKRRRRGAARDKLWRHLDVNAPGRRDEHQLRREDLTGSRLDYRASRTRM